MSCGLGTAVAAAAVALCLLQSVCGTPYMMLYSTRPKCVSVVAARGQTLSISYDAPDMKLPETRKGTGGQDGLAVDAIGNSQHGSESDQEDSSTANGMDERWNRRMKDKLERMQSKDLRDMTVTITPKGGMSSYLAQRRRPEDESNQSYLYRYGKERDRPSATRFRQELTEQSGTIDYEVGPLDGQIDICIQSISATKADPSRIGMAVLLKSSSSSVPQDGAEGNVNGPVLEHDTVHREMSRLERDLGTLTNRVQTLQSNADFNKQYEISFFEKSLAMNRASSYWPIIQLTVLVIAGFTQANHIVRYMKNHRIL